MVYIGRAEIILHYNTIFVPHLLPPFFCWRPHKMSSRLCEVCRSIPFTIWIPGYPDHMVPLNSTRIEARLQSFNSMEKASAKGCRLCNMIVSVLWLNNEKPKDANVCLFLVRTMSSENCIRIVPEKHPEKYAMSFLPMYPYLVPPAWSKSNNTSTFL